MLTVRKKGGTLSSDQQPVDPGLASEKQYCLTPFDMCVGKFMTVAHQSFLLYEFSVTYPTVKCENFSKISMASFPFVKLISNFTTATHSKEFYALTSSHQDDTGFIWHKIL